MELALANVLKSYAKDAESQPNDEIVLDTAHTISHLANQPFFKYIERLLDLKCVDTTRRDKIKKALEPLTYDKTGYISINMELDFSDDMSLSPEQRDIFKNMHVGLNLVIMDIAQKFDLAVPAEKGIRSIIFTESSKMTKAIVAMESAFDNAEHKLYNRVRRALGLTVNDKIFNVDPEWDYVKCALDTTMKLGVYGYFFDPINKLVYGKK